MQQERLSYFLPYFGGSALLPSMRIKGSCRFETYYKVQFYRPELLAWFDVQRQHPSEDAARTSFPKGKRCRVMMVTEKQRLPLPE